MKTVEKALGIIELVKDAQGLGATEIAQRIDSNKTTVFKIAAVLCNYGYLRKDPATAKYFIGPKFMEIGGRMLQKLDIRALALPEMKRLSEACRETINLMVLSGTRGTYVEVLESEKSARLSSSVGSSDYLHISAVGKVLLSGLSREELEQVIRAEGLPKTATNTITDPQALAGELERVRENGYATDDEESVVGARCVAAPVRGADGRVAAALSISGLTISITREMLNETYAGMVMEAAERISRKMG